MVDERLKGPAPSDAYETFFAGTGSALLSFSPMDQLICLPSLIAARGRARSLSRWRRPDGLALGEVECFYLEQAQPEAHVGRGGERFVVALHDGLAYQLWDIFSLVLSSPAVLPDFGDPALEDGARLRGRTKTPGYGLYRRSADETLPTPDELSHPNCPIRRHAALFLTGIALDAIWTHELGHCLLGHVDFVAENMGVRALRESPGPNGDLRQMPLEAEADRFAAQTVIEAAMTTTPYLPQSLCHRPVEMRVAAAFFCLDLLSWFWALHQRIDRNFDGIDPYERGTHPPPLTRRALARNIGTHLLAQKGWAADDVHRATATADQSLDNLSVAKEWFAILAPSRVAGAREMQFVTDMNRIMADVFRSVATDLEAFRFRPTETAAFGAW